MRKGNPCWQSVCVLEAPWADKWVNGEKKYIVTNNIITIPSYHVSMILLKLADHIVLWPSILSEMDKKSLSFNRTSLDCHFTIITESCRYGIIKEPCPNWFIWH